MFKLSPRLLTGRASRRRRATKEAETVPFDSDDLQAAADILRFFRAPSEHILHADETISHRNGELNRIICLKLKRPPVSKSWLGRRPDQTSTHVVLLVPRKGHVSTVKIDNASDRPPAELLSHDEHCRVARALILTRFLSVYRWMITGGDGVESSVVREAPRLIERLLSVPSLPTSEAQQLVSGLFGPNGTLGARDPGGRVDRLQLLCEELASHYHVIAKVQKIESDTYRLHYSYRQRVADHSEGLRRLRRLFRSPSSALLIHIPIARMTKHYEFRMEAQEGYYAYEQRLLTDQPPTQSSITRVSPTGVGESPLAAEDGKDSMVGESRVRLGESSSSPTPPNSQANETRNRGAENQFATSGLLVADTAGQMGPKDKTKYWYPTKRQSEPEQLVNADTKILQIGRQAGIATSAHLFVGDGHRTPNRLYVGVRLFEIPPGSTGRSLGTTLLSLMVAIVLVSWSLLHFGSNASTAPGLLAVAAGLGAAAVDRFLPRTDLLNAPLFPRLALLLQSVAMMALALWLFLASNWSDGFPIGQGVWWLEALGWGTRFLLGPMIALLLCCAAVFLGIRLYRSTRTFYKIESAN